MVRIHLPCTRGEASEEEMRTKEAKTSRGGRTSKKKTSDTRTLQPKQHLAYDPQREHRQTPNYTIHIVQATRPTNEEAHPKSIHTTTENAKIKKTVPEIRKKRREEKRREAQFLLLVPSHQN